MFSFRVRHKLIAAAFCSLLASCGGGYANNAPVPQSSIVGSAINSPVRDAEIKLFRFDSLGAEVEIVADNAPVLTDADGTYNFLIPKDGIDVGTGPLIVRTVGGSMMSAAAPTLEAVIADSTALESDANELVQYLSPASSVAAALFRLQVADMGAAPTTVEANTVIAKVENQLDVGLGQDPSDAMQPVAIFFAEYRHQSRVGIDACQYSGGRRIHSLSCLESQFRIWAIRRYDA